MGDVVTKLLQALTEGEFTVSLAKGAVRAPSVRAVDGGSEPRNLTTQACTASAGCPPPSNNCHTLGCR